MRRALLVNPYDAESVANAIAQALDMPLEERRARHQALLAVVSNYDIDRWQQDFMNALRGDNGTTQELQNLPAVMRPSAGWPASGYAGGTAAIETRGCKPHFCSADELSAPTLSTAEPCVALNVGDA